MRAARGPVKVDRAGTIAAFARICRHADRKELLRAIILRWPDITFDELRRGMALAAPRSQDSPLNDGGRWRLHLWASGCG